MDSREALMATIDMYVLEDRHGEPVDNWTLTEDYQEAKDGARERRCRVVCYEYEFSDSYIVDDFCSEPDTGPWDVFDARETAA